MRTLRHADRCVKVLAVLLLLAGLVTAIAPSAPAAVRRLSNNSSSSFPGGILFGVAAAPKGKAWAVGQVLSTGKTLILRWGGSSWRRRTSPSPSAGAELNAVAVTSADNAWAVGNTNGATPKTYILRWNGKTWTHVPSPTPVGGGALFSVTATSSGNAWAVGCAGNCFQEFGVINPLILHWTDGSWQQVPSPSTGLDSILTGVAAASAGSAWAVGCTAFCEISSASPQTVILLWTGASWEQVPSPASATVGALNGVTAFSARRAWAVGCTGHCFGPNATTRTMILAWNGTTWKRVPSPSPAGNSVLTSVAATSARNAWAVGYTRVSGKTLIAHWNGTSWKRAPSPTPVRGGSQLLGVAAASASNAWAVGFDIKANVILLHWNGTTWK